MSTQNAETMLVGDVMIALERFPHELSVLTHLLVKGLPLRTLPLEDLASGRLLVLGELQKTAVAAEASRSMPAFAWTDRQGDRTGRSEQSRRAEAQ